MRLNTLALFLPALFAISGVLAQQTASVTSGSPDVTYPPDYDSFVFCSAQDCTGTCEVVSTEYIPSEDGQYAPNDMPFLSIYWYNPYNYDLTLYTCLSDTECTGAPAEIGPDACYNLYYNGVATAYYEYFYYGPNGFE